ncbi:uncharacterized protein ISCGN_001760 [Ixodes scapularis]
MSVDGAAGGSGTSTSSRTPTSERESELRLEEAKERTRALEIELELARLGVHRAAEGRPAMTGERETQNDLKHFSKILSGVIRRFPSEAEVPVWFEAVETTFETYGVPRAIWGQLVFPHVVERVRYLATRLSAAELNDYDRVKDTVLEELQLAPGEYLKRFLSAAKGKEEAWMPFATRLRSYLHFYVEAREIKTKDDLIDLLVADQVKARMTPEALSYVTLKEDTNWHRAHELARLMRVFEQAEGRGAASKKVDAKVQQSSPRDEGKTKSGSTFGSTKFTRGPAGGPNSDRRRGCFGCGSLGHQRANCPHAGSGRANGKGDVPSEGDRLTARVVREPHSLPPSGLVNTRLACGGRMLNAIVDTGADITVVRESLVPEELRSPSGKIQLKSAFGESVEARLRGSCCKNRKARTHRSEQSRPSRRGKQNSSRRPLLRRSP